MKSISRMTICLWAMLVALCGNAQEAYYNMCESGEWEKLEKKIFPALEKQPGNVIYNHIAGLMFADKSYAGYDNDKAYTYLSTAKSEYGKFTAAEREKYSKYVTPKKIQREIDTVCNRLYAVAIHSQSVLVCNAFLKNYKRAANDLTANVTSYRNALAFAEAQQTNTVEAFQKFIVSYPEAAEVPSATKRRDKLAYDITLQQNTCDAFLAYLKNYPDSDYATEIHERYINKIFYSKSEGGTYQDYEVFVRANPQSPMAAEAIRRMMSIAKAKYDLPLMQKTVEQSRGIDFEYALHEFYKAFTDDGEAYTLYAFVEMYPRTFLDTLLAKDFKIAAKGDALELVAPFDSAKSYKQFAEYIKMAAPKEKAFVALQKLISNDVAAKKWKNAVQKVKQFQLYFGKDNKKILDLIALLTAPEDKTIVVSELSEAVNTKEGGEYSPIITADNKYLYFCGKNRKDCLGGEDVFVSEMKDGVWSEPQIVKELSSPKSNEAVISVSTDGTQMLLFREGLIYSAQRGAHGWENVKNVSDEINNATWSADAMITSDGNAIIFASVRDEGYNLFTRQNASLGVYHGAIHHQSDIYVSLKTDKGWSKPVNLGPTINTKYVDRSPYLHHDMKTLYFSSDGHGGFGNLDVFVSTRLADTCWDCWSEPINLGKEINNSEENWGYRIAPSGNEFYFAARKTGEKQNDLYSISIPKKYRPKAVATIQGKITNTSGKPVETNIVWEDLESGSVVEVSKSNPVDGNYFAVLPTGKMYGYYVDDEAYYPQSQSVDLTSQKNAQTVTKDIQVTSFKEMKEQKASVRLNNLFFETDKSTLLPYSIPELRRVAKIIRANNLQIEIAGHTDDVGDDAYNMTLSLRRAEAVKKFLVEEGCDEALFKVVGFGESKPTATNATEEGRAKNRRVEMRFL